MSFSSRTDAFNKFLQSKNIVLSPSVILADYRATKQGRGLKAVKDIEEGETLLTIPKTAFLTIDSDPEIGDLVRKHSLDAWSGLIVTMMALQSTPEWKPYFDVLPTEFNTPMFWAKEEINALLKGSSLVDKIGREDADALYDSLSTSILKEAKFAQLPTAETSRDAFHRMGSLIMSYAFDVNGEGYDEEGNMMDEDEDDDDPASKAMIPPADILNSHTKLQNAYLLVPEDNVSEFTMVSSKGIKKGEQIYNIYGNQPSSDMLRRYGFVERGGTNYEVVEISRDLVLKSAEKIVSQEQVCARDEKFNEYFDDGFETFEIGLVVDDGAEVWVAEAAPEVEFETELLIYACALVAPELKKKQVKEIISLVESDKLLEKAKNLLLEVVKTRKQEYGEIEQLNENESQDTGVYLDKKNMTLQVREAEARVLTIAEDWLNTANTVADLEVKGN